MKETSRIVERIKPSGIRRLFDLAQGMKGVISLGIGEPDFSTPPHIVEAYKKALSDGHTHYAPNTGIPELREALASKYKNDYGIEYDPKSEIIVTVGGSQALLSTLYALINPGDEVIIPDPGFMVYESDVLLAGGIPVPLKLNEEEGFKVNPDALNEAITPKTKLMILNLPSNPTGGSMTRKEQQEIAEVVKDSKLYVISDEVYEKIVYGEKHTNFASLGVRDHTVTVNSLSKTYAMAGLRLGYLMAPKELAGNIFKVHQATVACVNTATQKAAVAALTGPQDCVEEMRREYEKRRNAMVTGLNSLKNVSCTNPDGAFYAFANIKQTGLTDDEVCEKLLTQAKVVSVPGNAFGANGEGYLRFAYPIAVEKINMAVERMRPVFEALK